VVTDYATPAAWAEPGADAYCAPRGRACRDLVEHGIAASRVFATGIPVRPAFAEAAALRERPPGEPLRVLITSGGFGVGPVTRVLRSFMGVPHVSLTVVCGKNPRLVERVSHVVARLGIEARIIGFEGQMPLRVSEADVVVTKPGGLTVSECLAAGRPLVLVGAVPGQESLNESWVVEHGAGVTCAPESVGEIVARLRSDGLASMAQKARSLGVPDAADRVLDVALAGLQSGAVSVSRDREWQDGHPRIPQSF
jgi:processive 1,2-diacylglycerol beta-glucosyltransferase